MDSVFGNDVGQRISQPFVNSLPGSGKEFPVVSGSLSDCTATDQASLTQGCSTPTPVPTAAPSQTPSPTPAPSPTEAPTFTLVPSPTARPTLPLGRPTPTQSPSPVAQGSPSPP
jgi:hypothetical protein